MCDTSFYITCLNFIRAPDLIISYVIVYEFLTKLPIAPAALDLVLSYGSDNKFTIEGIACFKS